MLDGPHIRPVCYGEDKNLVSFGNRTSTVHPVARRYTPEILHTVKHKNAGSKWPGRGLPAATNL
jgi:hypothetical protein